MPYLPLLSVVVGAVLATVSGLLSGHLAAKREQRSRARFAAMIGMETLVSLQHAMRLLVDSHGRGDPFGRLTLRMVRVTRREVELYERNREAMFELGDDDLRFRLHDLMTRLAGPLDFLIDESAHGDGDPDNRRFVMTETFDVLRRHCGEISPMIDDLRRLRA